MTASSMRPELESARIARANQAAQDARSRRIRARADEARYQAAEALDEACRPLGCAEIDRGAVAARVMSAYGHRRAW